MNSVLTLVAPKNNLTKPIVTEAIAVLKASGANIGGQTWLADGEALDIAFEGVAPHSVELALRGALSGMPVDLLAGGGARPTQAPLAGGHGRHHRDLGNLG